MESLLYQNHRIEGAMSDLLVKEKGQRTCESSSKQREGSLGCWHGIPKELHEQTEDISDAAKSCCPLCSKLPMCQSARHDELCMLCSYSAGSG